MQPLESQRQILFRQMLDTPDVLKYHLGYKWSEYLTLKDSNAPLETLARTSLYSFVAQSILKDARSSVTHHDQAALITKYDLDFSSIEGFTASSNILHEEGVYVPSIINLPKKIKLFDETYLRDLYPPNTREYARLLEMKEIKDEYRKDYELCTMDWALGYLMNEDVNTQALSLTKRRVIKQTFWTANEIIHGPYSPRHNSYRGDAAVILDYYADLVLDYSKNRT